VKAKLLQRLLQLAGVSWGVGTLTFILMHALPGDMAYRIAAGRYGEDGTDALAADMVRQELSLDQNPFVAYWHWLLDLLQFNLGDSLISGMPVSGELWHMLSHSALLAGAGVLLSIVIALPLGMLSAYKGGWFDRATLMLSTVMRAVPVFVIGLVAVLIFGIGLNWLPIAGYGSVEYLILPALTLALSLAAISSRVVATETKRVLNEPFFEFARTKGLPFWRALQLHGLRNIAVPVVAFIGLQMIMVIEGVVMIESLFSWPGLGHGLAHAIFSRDIPVIQGTALALGALFVGLNTVVDILCHYLDRSEAHA
jgi:peptide/nickel transport system permease protein